MPLWSTPSAVNTRRIQLASTACCLCAFAVPFISSAGLTSRTVSHTLSRPSRALSARPPPPLSQHASLTMSKPSSTGSVGGGDGIVIPAPSGSADSVVIFLHGLGDTAAGWASGFPLPGLDSTKYVLPTAPKVPVTLNGGAEMPSWFDISGLDASSREDGPGIAAAAARVARIVADEVAAGIPAERIVIGGFSQGGAVAIAAALKSPDVFAGVIGLSTWLPLVASKGEVSGSMGKAPVFLAHGDADQVIALRWAQASVDVLKKLGVEAEMKVYGGMAHSSSNEELADVRRFLRKCFNSADAA